MKKKKKNLREFNLKLGSIWKSASPPMVFITKLIKKKGRAATFQIDPNFKLIL